MISLKSTCICTVIFKRNSYFVTLQLYVSKGGVVGWGSLIVAKGEMLRKGLGATAFDQRYRLHSYEPCWIWICQREC